MKTKIAIALVASTTFASVAFGQSDGSVTESGLDATKVVIQSAASVGGAGAYSASEKSACNFAVVLTVPRCVNSIFGLLQMEVSLQGLDNSRKVAMQILGEGNSNLLVDLKAEGFCINPLTDSCTQDAVDIEVIGLYDPLRLGTDAAYTLAISNLQTQINGRLAEFELNGYVIDKVGYKVTPPIGPPESFSGGTAVAAVLFNQSEAKFSNAVARIETAKANQASAQAPSLLATAQLYYNSLAASSSSASVPATSSSLTVSSKTSASKTKAPSFLASLTDAQKLSADVAPQGEEVFGSVSGRYNKMQKAGDFIQP